MEQTLLIYDPTYNNRTGKLFRSISCYSYILMISLDCKNKMADYLVDQPFVLMISIDLMKSSDVRIAGDQPD